MKPSHTRWLRRAEVPEDDGTPTGRHFLHEQRLIGVDPLTGEPDYEDTGQVLGPFTPTRAPPPFGGQI